MRSLPFGGTHWAPPRTRPQPVLCPPPLGTCLIQKPSTIPMLLLSGSPREITAPSRPGPEACSRRLARCSTPSPRYGASSRVSSPQRPVGGSHTSDSPHLSSERRSWKRTDRDTTSISSCFSVRAALRLPPSQRAAALSGDMY